MVYVYNQRTALTKVPEPVIANSVPLAPMNQVAMLTNYVSPGETSIADPNQDVVYGLGYLSLEKESVVIQVPDFGDRFWTGFYMVVGPNWKGDCILGHCSAFRFGTSSIPRPRTDGWQDRSES